MKYSYLSVNLALLAIGVLICCIGVLFETQSQYNIVRTREKNTQLSAECAQYKLKHLFIQELLWYRLLAKTLKSPGQATKEQELILQRLLQNQKELGTALVSLSCPEAHQTLTQVLQEQVNQALLYSQACHSKNSKLKRETQKAWLEATHKLAHILSCEGAYKNPLILQQALVQHRALLEQELGCESKKSLRTSIPQSDAFFENITCLVTQLLPHK